MNTQETPDSSEGGRIHRPAVRLPTFWPDRPGLWFAHAEAQFALAGVTSETTKFHYVISQLPIQQLNWIFCKKRRNTTLHRPTTTNKSRSNSRRLSGQHAAQTNSLVCSLSGQQAAQADPLACSFAGQHAAQTDSLVCSLAGQQAAQADSLAAASPDPCATSNNQLP